MPTKTIVNLASANETYTAAAGDYEINGMGGNDTITTGAGNSFVTIGVGNSTITTGAGDSIVKTLDGNQTITTGAGNSSVTTGVGNSTITTGAGDSTVLASGGNNTVTTGAGASNVTTGVGDDTITAGAGDAVVDSGLGNDTVTTAAGNDLVTYRVTGNAGHHSLFTAAAGVDTLNLVMTRAEWMSDAVQTDVATYLSFLAANKGASGENNATEYTFKAFGLTASAFEKLQVHVDGVSIDPANHPVALGDDEMTTTENEVSAAVDVLSNDSVPDLIKTLTYTDSLNGSVQLDAAYVNTASPAAAQFIYTPTAGFYDYLAVGETANDVFTYTVTDATGDVKTATVNVTITGTNDAPVITSATQAAGVSEGNDKPLSAMSASGTVGYRDVDLSDMHTLSISTAAAYGNASVDAQGNWSYTVVDAGAVNALAVGEHLADSFTVMVDDGHGGKALQSVHIEITGTNDAPIITSSAQAGAVKEDAALVATGTVASSDVDNGATATYTGSATGTYGSFAVNAATGVWTYTLANAAHQNLAQGESQSETFTVTVTDDKGAAASQVVVMSITGTNDAPVIGIAVLSGTVTEQITPAGNLISSGAINFSDVDLSDVHTVSAVMSAADTLGSLTATVSTDDSHTTGLDGVVTWAYSVADSAVEYLAAGQTKVETFTVSLSDGHGGVVQSTVSVTIAGTNDAAVMTGTMTDPLYAATHPAWGTFTNASGVWIAPNGGSDGDILPHSVIRQFVASQAGTYDLKFSADNFGSVSIDGIAIAGLQGFTQYSSQATGSIFLAAGTHTIVMDVQNYGGPAGFALTVADPTGNVIWNTRTQLDPVALVVAYTENQAAQAISAGLTIAYIDSMQLVSATVSIGNGFATGQDILGFVNQNGISGSYNSASGVLGLNGLATVAQYQAALRSVSYSNSSESPSTAARTVNFVVNDGASQFNLSNTVSSTVIVRAVNDVPIVATTDVTGSVIELTTTPGTARLTESGTIAFTDADLTDNHSISSVMPIASALGTLTASVSTDSTGTGLGGVVTWNYSVADSAVEYLATGEAKVETFSFNVMDGKGGSIERTITVTITGTNDAPMITSAAQSGAVTGGAGQAASSMTATGQVTFSDVDLTDTGTLSISTAAGHGSTSVNSLGKWSYTVNNDSAVTRLTSGQHLTDSFTVLVDDLHGGRVSQSVSIDIGAPNHAPVANPDSGVSINSNGSVPVSFTPIGSAYQNGTGSSEYVITQALNTQVGALWSNSKVSLNSSFSISAQLYFGTKDYDGADGFSFIVQNQSKTVIGLAGQGLGYQGITKSVGVEFDTYYNGGTTDIENDHMNINTGGLMNAVGGVIDLGNIEDGRYHGVNINWAAFTKMLTISFDNAFTETKYVDMVGEVGNAEAYIGFAGSTGGSVNLQKINTLNYKSVDSSVVLDVLANDTDVDTGDKAGLKVISAASTKGATVNFSGLAGAGITYSPSHAFDNLAVGSTTTDMINYTIADSHGAMSSSIATITIVGVALNV